MSKINLTHAFTFLSGLLLGWLAIGWWLWPVAYVGDAYPYELNQADKLRYAQGAVDGFTLTGQVDPDWFSGWTGDEIKDQLEQVVQQPVRANSTRAMAEKMGLLLGWRVNINPTPVPLTVKLAKAQANQADGAGLPDWLPYLAFAILGIGLAGGGLWVGYRVQTKSHTPDFELVPNPHILPTIPGEFQGLRQAVRAASQLAHARLDFGSDHPTDQHFPIESQQEGEPSLGEFGVNQVEDTMAWDIWLFDQKALVTVTKVLADKTSEEISSRGEIVGWADPIVLETPNLKMVGSVENSFVDELHHSKGIFTIELAVEAKEE